ncbi:acylphosphatase [Pseudodesulfovibrio cashew]|uniref:Acylphosphatase n=1 Tax=Pseudodesulfovibrio cashew TaxID=2678688 RepID=A0A6I6JHU9_9BACT|nr:acylphosphatase [Pseudodesulfovibrio cashew]QGY40043.1 acylphosphatase [Pseudodesulfovibrio cashew]
MREMHAVVHGKVQGVWFRAWTRDVAREMGVTGWVRNLPGGPVEVTAQGSDDDLDAFLARLHDGPPLARVSRIETSRSAVEERFERFDVRV